ncbi:DNA cytosine methyltransferase [Aeromonas sp. 11P]|uniref:DNA cytosine methyltransferase n=1 Tax=Aeromonas sp. 11P TaxID=3452713 RepID=UPI003F7AF89F
MFKPTVHSYFSGAGLMDTGLIFGGLPIARSFELDPLACKVQAANLGDHVENVDVTQLCVTGQGEADVIIGTYPCTRYSNIADIKGTRTGDDLFLHFFRHIALMRPEVYVVENVPGMTKFPVVMEAMTQLPDYYVTTFNPVRAEHMVPQRRDRLIIMGSRRPFTWNAPDKGKVPSLMSLLERDPEIVIPPSVYARLNGQYRDKPIISDPFKGDIAPTCLAHYAKDKGTRLVIDPVTRKPRPYTVREYARLMGLPDFFTFDAPDSDAYRMIGNGVVFHKGVWVANEIVRYFSHSHRQSRPLTRAASHQNV